MEKPIEEYTILNARSSSELVTQVKAFKTDGWRPIGSHQVATKHISVERAGTQHRYTLEYTQTLVRP
jgi:hypothetical protein